MNNAQLGIVAETTYGMPVTVDRFLEFLPGESLERQQMVINSQGLRPGLKSRLGPRRARTKQWGAGTVQLEVATQDFGLLFLHMLGGGSVTQTDTGTFTHIYQPESLLGKSLTVQKGVEKTTTETAQAFTFHGTKITEWEFSISQDGFLLLQLGTDSEDVDTSTALASASLPVIRNLAFHEGTISVDDTPIGGVSQATMRGTNPLNTERWFLTGSRLKEEPLENGFREYGGNLTAEFRGLAEFYNAFAQDTALDVKLLFVGDTLSGTHTEALTIQYHDVRFTGETPKVSGPEPAVQNAPFEAFEDNAGDSVTITYVTADTTS
jgi:hypothetical protein